MFFVGVMGVIVIYGGFLYLFFSGRDTSGIPWIFLLSPWACIFFGLSKLEQRRTLAWFIAKFKR
ncbi:MAG: hypothetical protein LPD71_02650 [Shewanella sp.]|nr:hypothetical protein [Shewanella sp.]MCF1429954.1 hypothetical protein [Shewanella sp.]MCF1437674.1 hypothetical protein [Shewanella sp.]MCF1456153.1 hypothetical protein [Shewanella sp.]